MRLAAVALTALLVLPASLAAQTPSERDQVLEAFSGLLGPGEMRAIFNLPEEAFWRRSERLSLALFAENADELLPILQRATAPFADATGLAIDLVESGSALPSDQDTAVLAPEADLVIAVGSRTDLAPVAVANGFDIGMLARFEMGTLPFMFTFAPDQHHRGVVLLADDEPEVAREAAFVVATVWALGGVTLGPELTGLVENSGNGPVLTPRGESVFKLFFHEGLENGMPLDDAVQRAGGLLPQ